MWKSAGPQGHPAQKVRMSGRTNSEKNGKISGTSIHICCEPGAGDPRGSWAHSLGEQEQHHKVTASEGLQRGAGAGGQVAGSPDSPAIQGH